MAHAKVALVTGSGKRRVGWYVAEALAARGYALAIHYNRSADEAAETVAAFRTRGVEAAAYQADLSDEGSVYALIDNTMAHFGRLDVLVNCAATWRRKRLEEITPADLRYDFETNTLGTFLCSQRAGLAMVRQPEGGCIVLLGDWAVARHTWILPRISCRKVRSRPWRERWPSNLAVAIRTCASTASCRDQC
jgi:pteridine reductase